MAWHGRGTAWARNGSGMGAAWFWHSMCELAFRYLPMWIAVRINSKSSVRYKKRAWNLKMGTELVAET
jgi:hypothetical protein